MFADSSRSPGDHAFDVGISLGGDDDGVAPRRHSTFDLLQNDLFCQGHFRYQDQIGAAGFGHGVRQKARVPPQDFEGKEVRQGLPGIADAVEHPHAGIDSGVEAEGRFRAGHVVVDGSRQADHLASIAGQVSGCIHRAVATQHHQRRDAQRLQRRVDFG